MPVRQHPTVVDEVRKNWLMIVGLATLCFTVGGAWMRLSSLEHEVTIMSIKVDDARSSYITRPEHLDLAKRVDDLTDRVKFLEHHAR